jgi:hypothetical protein
MKPRPQTAWVIVARNGSNRHNRLFRSRKDARDFLRNEFLYPQPWKVIRVHLTPAPRAKKGKSK